MFIQIQNFYFLVLIRGILSNQTVLKGSPLKLSCRVSTDEVYPVKWLKKLSDNEQPLPDRPGFLYIDGSTYKVFCINTTIICGGFVGFQSISTISISSV